MRSFTLEYKGPYERTSTVPAGSSITIHNITVSMFSKNKEQTSNEGSLKIEDPKKSNN